MSHTGGVSTDAKTNPLTPERQNLRALLQLVAARLLVVHRGLIDDAIAKWAISTHSMPPSPLEQFRLLREDPAFAWLQPLTSLIVTIGELASAREFKDAD